MAKAKKRKGGPPPVPRTKEQKASARSKGMISGYLSRPRGRPKTDLAAEAFYAAAQPAQWSQKKKTILLHNMLRKRHTGPI